MALTLEGTVALVTGASSGIGEATARALAAEGAAVALVARRKDRLDALAAELGDRTLAIEADVTQQDQAVGAVGQAVDELGRLDVVVNNAGVMLLGPVVDAPTEEWDRMVALNLNGLLYVAHAALPHLIVAAEGEPRRVADLVNISSVAGRRAAKGGGVYQLTKFGVGAFSESLRQEVTRRHVRVSLVEPGAVSTELASHVREEIRERLVRAVRQHGAPAGAGHRRRDRLRRHARPPHRDQRDPHQADRAGGMTMQRIAISAHLRGEAAEPSGEPPQTDPRTTSVSVDAVAADGTDAAIERMSYANHVVFTGESTFTETGTVALGGDDDELDVVTVGEGTLEPSAEPELLQGAVIWRVAAGRGRFAGASGLITSNFLLRPATGEVDEWQAGVVFVP